MDYDVIVIGGGITGAGILRDCALRGLRAVLLEKREPGLGTTAASTHLIHGGLRYLLYDRLTTHTTCWDSGNIVRIARPHLTRLPILWPVYRDHRHGIETVETLMQSYDAFSRMKEGRPHLRLPAAETLRLVPCLKPGGLLGAVSFDEWWVDPVRLVQANLDSALAAGAEARIRTAATGMIRESRSGENTRIVGVEAQDPSGRGKTLRGSVIINAAGPWVNAVAGMAGARIPMRLRKGTHLIYDRNLLPAAPDSPVGLLLEAEDRERYVFIVSAGGKTLVGPTDLPCPDDPGRLATNAEEIRYLLASARRYFPEFPERFDRTIVGARPILGQRGSEKLLSREYEIVDHAREGLAGFLTAAGGKMSDFRLMAQDAVDAACRSLGKEAAPCRTAEWTLKGEPLAPRAPFPRPPRWLKHFLRRHPHLRELHAVACLGAAFAKHWARRASSQDEATTSEQFRKYYS